MEDKSMDKLLDQLAQKHGVCATRPSPDNKEVPVDDSVKRKVLEALGVSLEKQEDNAARHLKRRPTIKRSAAKCFLPGFLETERVWGLSLQLYELSSDRNWGVGDFQDLVDVARFAGSLGADFVGLNPLHAPFLADPERCSPYEPSNRQMLNPLYIAVDRVAGFRADPEWDARLQGLRHTKLVDYRAVAEIKLAVLRDLWRKWCSAPSQSADDRDSFGDFVAEGGNYLRRHAVFESLSFFMGKQGKGTGWKTWPCPYQRPDAPAVVEFANAHAETIEFHMWLQWLAHRQLMSAVQAARDAGMRIGLYLDLAVGEAIDGSATWSEPEAYLTEATIGSPPDPFATEGQDWHLAAIHPDAIAAGEQAPYKRMVEAAMRYAGAIRIDHAAALRRLFLVPVDSRPDGGAYVAYPQDDLLQILSVASEKFRCLVIGEDLGMLPKGLQEDLAEAQILSYRILSYEREESGFKAADSYPRLSLACISTHDHQTLAGWWRGADIKARAEHGIVPDDTTEVHVEEREAEREELQVALAQAGVRVPKQMPSAAASDAKLKDLVLSAHRFIARTPSLMVAIRLADMTGEKQPTNIPGTSDTYPNWKPKLSVTLEQLKDVPLLLEIAAAVQEERRSGQIM
jgi:4-alpha-glucanotransferase